MKKLIASIIACSCLLMTASGFVSGVSAASYSDVPETHWAYKAVERCKASHWFAGYPDGSFRPDAEITRAEAAKVFVTFMSEPLASVTTSTSFYDVQPTDWFAPYVEAGKDLFPERTAMNGQKKFQPDMPVTREDTIYALVTALNYDTKVPFADQSVLNMFKDANSISAICKPYIAVAVSNEIASGYNDNTIRAQDPLTRAQFATLLYRATLLGALAETQKVITSISITPSVLSELEVGDSIEIKATATYSDGSTEDYSSKLNPYTDDKEGVITINKNKITAVGEGTVIVKFNCEDVKNEQLVVKVDAPAK